MVNEGIDAESMSFPNGRVYRHPDCYVIAGANTFGTGADRHYAGRNQLDSAFLNRFTAKFIIDYDEALELAATLRTGLDPTIATELLNRIRHIRGRANQATIKAVVATQRDSVGCAKLMMAGFTLEEAITLAIENGISATDYDKVK